jgi:AcrR family transcriptional regulator
MTQPSAEPRTSRGVRTKAKIVAAAAELMYERGVNLTSVEEVLRAAGAGKSQFYHYFPSRQELIAAVLRHQLTLVLQEQSRFPLNSWEGVQAWLESMIVAQQTHRRFLGCPLGSLAGEVLEHEDLPQATAAEAFDRWQDALADGLSGLRDQGLLRADVDLQELAQATIATVQGGYLLSSAMRDIAPMRNALAAAQRHLQAHAP